MDGKYLADPIPTYYRFISSKSYGRVGKTKGKHRIKKVTGKVGDNVVNGDKVYLVTLEPGTQGYDYAYPESAQDGGWLCNRRDFLYYDFPESIPKKDKQWIIEGDKVEYGSKVSFKLVGDRYLSPYGVWGIITEDQTNINWTIEKQ